MLCKLTRKKSSSVLTELWSLWTTTMSSMGRHTQQCNSDTYLLVVTNSHLIGLKPHTQKEIQALYCKPIQLLVGSSVLGPHKFTSQYSSSPQSKHLSLDLSKSAAHTMCPDIYQLFGVWFQVCWEREMRKKKQMAYVL